MRKIAIDFQHPPHYREQSPMLSLIPAKGDGESLRVHLSDTNDHGLSQAAERADVLTFRREHIDDVRR